MTYVTDDPGWKPDDPRWMAGYVAAIRDLTILAAHRRALTNEYEQDASPIAATLERAAKALLSGRWACYRPDHEACRGFGRQDWDPEPKSEAPSVESIHGQVASEDDSFEDEDDYLHWWVLRLLVSLPRAFWYKDAEYKALVEQRLDEKDDVWQTVARQRRMSPNTVRELVRQFLLGRATTAITEAWRKHEVYLAVWEALQDRPFAGRW